MKNWKGRRKNRERETEEHMELTEETLDEISERSGQPREHLETLLELRRKQGRKTFVRYPTPKEN